MKKNIYYGIVTILVVILLLCVGCVDIQENKIKYRSTENVIPKVKQGRMTFDITIRANKTAKTIQLWLPYPVSNDDQKIEDVVIKGNYNYSGIHREAEYGNMILYAEWYEPPEYPQLNFSFNVSRTEVIMKNFPEVEESIPVDVKEFLLPTNLSPTTGEVKDHADQIIKGKNTILSKATAIYDYLVEHGERDPNLSFCGDGDVCELLKNLRGKCVDFSSVFVALSRSVGIPAREILGTRVAKDGDITGAYHCRAEFYLPGYGWIPVDPSDVAKLMLKENLELTNLKVIDARDYYFGAQTETYIDLSTGRDIVLNPVQESEPLNYFMYPYAEIDGQPLDFISQEYLKYIVTFLEH
ncbi:MAG: transglutaminase domain-containing protein [Thermoplasmatales archaeon]|nr:MAG: transglutaminase domain-containing protein [Thermoplasmatales archaeon]